MSFRWIQHSPRQTDAKPVPQAEQVTPATMRSSRSSPPQRPRAMRCVMSSRAPNGRRRREEERARLVQDIAAAAANVEALQAALAAREQEHTQALAEQQARLEAGQSGLTAREQERAQLLAQLNEEQARTTACSPRSRCGSRITNERSRSCRAADALRGAAGVAERHASRTTPAPWRT